MPTIIITANTDGTLSLNCSFLSILKKTGTVSVPLGSEPAFISFQPIEKEFSQVNCLIENGRSGLKCSRSDAKLLRWNENIYELMLLSRKTEKILPPIITEELRWGNGYAGLAGNFFVYQDKNGVKFCSDFQADSFITLSENFALLKNNKTVTVADKNLSLLFPPIENAEFNIGNNELTLEFSPCNMEFFKITLKYSVIDMHLISSFCKCEPINSVKDRMRCFCQAVRLGLREDAEKFLTDSLKHDMPFDSICDFLGPFDETDLPRHIFCEKENAVALRYVLDENNFHYICYEFSLTENGLIDDIAQL